MPKIKLRKAATLGLVSQIRDEGGLDRMRAEGWVSMTDLLTLIASPEITPVTLEARNTCGLSLVSNGTPTHLPRIDENSRSWFWCGVYIFSPSRIAILPRL